jgi:hypothetical protein
MGHIKRYSREFLWQERSNDLVGNPNLNQLQFLESALFHQVINARKRHLKRQDLTSFRIHTKVCKVVYL